MDAVGGLFGSDSGSGGSSTQTVVANIPDWLTNPLQSLVSSSTSLAGKPYEAYTGQRVADFTPDQLQAFGMGRGFVGGTDAAYGNAQDIQNQVAQYGLNGPTQGQINQYMNPYINNVLDAQRQRSLQNYDLERNRLSAQQGQIGAFGGSRSAVAQDLLLNNFNQNQDYNNATGYANAYQAALAGLQQGMQTASAAGQNTYRNAINQQAAGLQQYNALANQGALQQANSQQGLDAAYQEFLTSQSYPYQQLQFQSSIINPIASLYRGQTTTNTQQQNTGGSGLLGILGGIGSIASGAGLFGQTGLGGIGLDNWLGSGSLNPASGGLTQGGFLQFADGGHVKAYADGGNVTENVDNFLNMLVQPANIGSSYIPKPIEQNLNIQPLQAPQQSSGGGGEEKGGGIDFGQIASLAMMFLKDGGEVKKYAKGGGVGDDDIQALMQWIDASGQYTGPNIGEANQTRVKGRQLPIGPALRSNMVDSEYPPQPYPMDNEESSNGGLSLTVNPSSVINPSDIRKTLEPPSEANNWNVGVKDNTQPNSWLTEEGQGLAQYLASKGLANNPAIKAGNALAEYAINNPMDAAANALIAVPFVGPLAKTLGVAGKGVKAAGVGSLGLGALIKNNPKAAALAAGIGLKAINGSEDPVNAYKQDQDKINKAQQERAKAMAPNEEFINLISNITNGTGDYAEEKQTPAVDSKVVNNQSLMSQASTKNESGLNIPLMAFGAALLGSKNNFFKALGEGTDAFIGTKQKQDAAAATSQQQAFENQVNLMRAMSYKQQVEQANSPHSQELKALKVEQLRQKLDPNAPIRVNIEKVFSELMRSGRYTAEEAAVEANRTAASLRVQNNLANGGQQSQGGSSNVPQGYQIDAAHMNAELDSLLQ